MRRTAWNNVVCLALAPFLGLAAMVLPVLVRNLAEGASFFALVDDSINGYEGSAVVLLLAVGAGLGSVSTLPSWLVGLGGIAALPLVNVAEMVVDPTSNNIWPIAWVFYFFEWAPVFIGAEVAQRHRRHRGADPPSENQAR